MNIHQSMLGIKLHVIDIHIFIGTFAFISYLSDETPTGIKQKQAHRLLVEDKDVLLRQIEFRNLTNQSIVGSFQRDIPHGIEIIMKVEILGFVHIDSNRSTSIGNAT